MTITNAEIVSRLKLLADFHLKADSGSTTTAVSSVLIDETTIANSYICFINGDNINTDKVVTSFFTETGTCTFDTVTSAITNTDEFCIVKKGFQSDVAQAENIVRNDLRNRGYDLDLFLNYTTQLRELYIYKTIEIVCAGLMNDGVAEDVYFVQYGRFNKRYMDELSTLLADYDANENGTIEEDEETVAISNYGVMGR